VARLAAERLSRKLIRAFPPSSAFQALKASQIGLGRNCAYIPETLPAAEVQMCGFRTPDSDQWKEIHTIPRRYRMTMARLGLRAFMSERPAQ
jgi:hypothetical protein